MSDLRSPAPATGFELPGSGYHDPVPNRAAMFGWLAVCGGLVAAIAVVTLDVLLGGEPVRGRTRRLQTISEYVYSSGAWAFDIGVVALAAGSAALILGLVCRRLVTPISPGSIFLTLWVFGLAGIVAFPKHNWAIGPSGSGTVHRVASLIAFLAGPVAVLLIARRHRDSGVARAAFWLAIGGLAFLGVLVGAIVTAAVTGGSWWQLIPLGLVERGITGFDVAAVVALGVWVIRGDQPALSRLERPSGRRARKQHTLGQTDGRTCM